MVFQMTLRSAIFLEPIDAAAFDGDIAAKNQLKAALTAVLVTDTFSRRVEEGSEITSVGPATLIPLSNLGFDQGSAVSIAFELVATYLASVSEDVSSTEKQIYEDFQTHLVKQVLDDALQKAIDEAVDSGRRVLRTPQRSLSDSTLASATGFSAARWSTRARGPSA